MSIPNRSAINRANSRHSTGPKTAEGKQRSSLNALRHGLTGQIVVMPAEDLQAYQRHLQSFTDELRPVGVIEANLVQSLADCTWRLNRVAALETNLLSLAVTGGADPIQDALAIAAALQSQTKALSNLSLHTQRLSRQFERTVNQLREIQNTRHAQEQHDLSSLLDILEMHKDKGESYDLSADGFVFSDEQIAAARVARRREQLAEQAYDHCLEAAA